MPKKLACYVSTVQVLQELSMPMYSPERGCIELHVILLT